MSFTPTPEAVEAVAKQLCDMRVAHLDASDRKFVWERDKEKESNRARAAIAAFVEAEGLEVEERENYELGVPHEQPFYETRSVGPWRKRD